MKQTTKVNLKPLVKNELVPIRATTLKVINIIPNADLRLQFGLLDVLRKFGIKIQEMDYGTCYIFVNTAGKYVKMIVGNRSEYPVIACYMMPRGQRFPLDACGDIARAFRYPKQVNANTALKEAMNEYYSKSNKTRHITAH